ncbi:hypothetical protein CcrC1_gp437 [Caulobacter phage C1]|nr:hypothetical protein CcrC1_gp437 [Caulobacter phage C1]UTU08666.1 hypothetical protein CcrC2_gp438 [Caulobacter phage C2]UTU09744.1 hypothetical protein CcrBL47_gp460 [Caulobacter phage BL47]UTU10298.1 hypothetical protein CcrRB23_gp436 [Caulobacter phage RB23]WGN97332.1 hypothetical protein [Bertelyvirus sp.]
MSSAYQTELEDIHRAEIEGSLKVRLTPHMLISKELRREIAKVANAVDYADCWPGAPLNVDEIIHAYAIVEAVRANGFMAPPELDV